MQCDTAQKKQGNISNGGEKYIKKKRKMEFVLDVVKKQHMGCIAMNAV